MSHETPQSYLLETLQSLKDVIIRPFSRINCEVAFLVYYTGKKDEGHKLQRNPVICSIEVNEASDHVKVKVGNDDTKIMARGGILTNNKTVISYSYDTTNVLGIIDGERLTDASSGDSARDFEVRQTMYKQHETWDIKDRTSGNRVAFINRSPKASGIKVTFSLPVTSNIRFMFMIYGLACMFRKYSIHRHPIPTNLYPVNPSGTAIPSQLAVLRNLKHLTLRLCFIDAHGSLFMDYLDLHTHEVKLIVEYTTDDNNTIVFKDLFGTAHFIAKELIDDPRGFTVFTPQSGNTRGKLLGYYPREVDAPEYIDGDTNKEIMIEMPKSENGLVRKICLAGSDRRSVICEHYTHPNQHTINIDFIEDTSDKNKALILAQVVSLAMRFRKFGKCLLPAVNVYPFQPVSSTNV